MNKRPHSGNPRSYGGMSPEERTTRRRQQFMEAGKTLFGTLGYRKTTVRLLCQEAGLTDRYLYESFDSVEALLVAVYEDLVNEMLCTVLDAVKQDIGTADTGQIVRHGFDTFFRITEDAQLSRILWIEILGVSPGVDAIYHVTLRRFADMLFSLAQELKTDWQMPENVLRLVCMGVIGAASETAKDWMLADYNQPRQVLVESMLVIFRGVLHQADTP